MANYLLSTILATGRKEAKNSNEVTMDFVSIKVGTSGLEIKETSSQFDFSAKKLTNIAAGTASGHAVEYAQLNTALSAYILSSEKGAALGVATLDGGGKIPAAQLPNSVMEFQGSWNATTNSPSLADGTGNAGDVYRVSVAGTQDLGSGSFTYAVGDWAMYNGSIWQKSPGTDAVTSVNSLTGAVTLTTSDIAEGSNLYFSDERAQDAIGAMVANSSKVSLTYVDATPSLTANIVAGSLVNADINASAAIVESKLSLNFGTSALNTSISNHIADLANPHAVTKTQVGLSNVDNLQQIPMSYLDTDGTLAANSDTKVPSQKAVKTYVDAQVSGGSSSQAAFTNSNGSTITVRQCVYIKSDGSVALAKANIDLSATELGLVYDASILDTASGMVTIKDGAIVTGFSGLTPGKAQYVSRATAGALTESLSGFVTGEHVFQLGIAITATSVKYKPMYEYVLG